MPANETVSGTPALPGSPFVAELARGVEEGRLLLLEALHRIQDEYGYLPKEALDGLAAHAPRACAGVHAFVATLPRFRRAPSAPLRVEVCTGLACRLNGGERVLAAAHDVAEEVGGGTLGVREVGCLGQCEHAPALLVNERIYQDVYPQGLDNLLGALLREGPGEAPPVPARHEDLHAARLRGGYRSFEDVCLGEDAGWVVDGLAASGLRGLGRGGFGVAAKWEAVRKASGSPKYVVVNAQESEPGSFKDRVLLETEPHRVLEGALIAAAVVGAQDCFVCLRAEYRLARSILEKELAALAASGLLWPATGGGGGASGGSARGGPGPFRLRLIVGGGGYLGGQETALLEALEGRRQEPRLTPPHPAERGLWAKPTLVQNAETLAVVPRILELGAGWFRNQGRGGASGARLFSISGQVKRPGAYLAPMGTSARELIQAYAGGVSGGRALKAFFPGGALSGALPAERADLPMSFEAVAEAGSALGCGALVVVATGTCIVRLASRSLDFLARETCGKCAACKDGTARLRDAVGALTRGELSAAGLSALGEVPAPMAAGSICGLGRSAAAPLVSGLAHFRGEFEAHVRRECPERQCF
ncbi:MAG: NAD(P)H-dependent oxidoreductase subunit E [Planctomycetes bacterium]|nr:NAD(P)H-dependent oxidoreductase subunit E [Planctomycetota bacterium]